jgi:hypothetical protein
LSFLIIYVLLEGTVKTRELRGIGRPGRRYFIGGSHARIIMGDDEAALIRLWQERRGEVEPEDLSGNLIVQLGIATENLNRRRYEPIIGRMFIGWYIVALCYATAVFLVGWWPWNVLLILPALLSSNRNPLRFSVFVTRGQSLRSKAFCGRGGSL